MICCHQQTVVGQIVCYSPMIRTGAPLVKTPADCDACPFANYRCGESITFDTAGPPATPGTPEGCGLQLYKIFRDDFKINAAGCGGCGRTLAWMNELGPDGCQANRAEIVRQIAANKRTAGIDWKATAAAIARGVGDVLTGKLWINPIDPLGSLVDAAIARERARLAAG